MSELVKTCPGCRSNTQPDKKFCTECGFNIEELREKKRKKIRIEELKQEKSIALKNCYTLMILSALPLIPMLIANRMEAYENETMIICDWIGAAVIVGFILCKGRSFKEFFQPSGEVMKWTAVGLLVCAGMLVLNFSYHHLLLSFFNVKEESLTSGMISKGMSIAAVFFYISVMPGIWEEFLFRGLLLKELEIIVTPIEAAILSSVVFALFHMTIFSIPYLALFGYLLVILKRESGSLLPGIILHTFHNAVIVASEVWS